MRFVSVMCACLLTACSTQTVRCERHLTPINVPRRPISDALAPTQAKEASAEIHGTTKPERTQRATADGESGEPKHPMPTAGKESP
jgi:hypothetical protein